MVSKGDQFFFFVTLEKEDLAPEHRYKDRFLSRDTIEWQSQNRTRRESGVGQKFLRHAELGITCHLFVRKQTKIAGKSAPFFYCGPLEFIDWEGDKPITVRWRLAEPVPDSLWPILKPPADMS